VRASVLAASIAISSLSLCAPRLVPSNLIKAGRQRRNYSREQIQTREIREKIESSPCRALGGGEGGSYPAWAKTASHGETRYVIKSFDKPILSPAPFHSDPVVYTLPTLDLFRHPKVLTISRRSTHGKSKISNKTHKEEDSILLPFNRRNKATNQTVEHVGAGSATRGRTKIDQRRERVSKTSNGQFNTTLFTFSPFYLWDVKASVNNAS
jgi:hypothetical protein